MSRIAVVGATGIVGKSVVSALIGLDSVKEVVAIDRRPGSHGGEKVTSVLVDIASAPLDEHLRGVDSVILLTEGGHRRSDSLAIDSVLSAVVDACETAVCRHLVFVSSAMVYGASRSNPIPLTEDYPVAKALGLPHAKTKQSAEESLGRLSESSGVSVCVLRPTTTVSFGSTSAISAEILSARAFRRGSDDAPTQYLHLDDLAGACVHGAIGRLEGVFNVSPDAWLGAGEFRELSFDANEHLSGRYVELYANVAKGLSRLHQGLDDYVRFPWVVSNDKLKATGWNPVYTNAEAFISFKPTPLWKRYVDRYRQEVQIGVVATGLAGCALGFYSVLKRWSSSE